MYYDVWGKAVIKSAIINGCTCISLVLRQHMAVNLLDEHEILKLGSGLLPGNIVRIFGHVTGKLRRRPFV